MNRLKQVRTTIRKESGKKLQAFTLLTTLLVALIVFSLGLVLDGYSKIRMLDQYLRDIFWRFAGAAGFADLDASVHDRFQPPDTDQHSGTI